MKPNVRESSSHWTLQDGEPGSLFSSKVRGEVWHRSENQENAPQDGDHVTPEEEIPVEKRDRVSSLVRASVLASETGALWPVKAAVRSPWIGLNKGVVFYGTNWVVQTQSETRFIYFHSCAGLEGHAEMTPFHILVMLTNGQFIKRERQCGNSIFLRTVVYVYMAGAMSNSP